MTQAKKLERLTTHPGSDLRQLEVQTNNLIPDVQTTQALNSSTTETDLMTYSLPANSLSLAGHVVCMEAWGTTANNANAKTLKVYFGSASTSFTLTASQAGRWAVQLVVSRTGASTQNVYINVTEGTASLAAGKCAIVSTTATQTDTSAITIKCTGTGGASSDISQDGMMVWQPAAAIAMRSGVIVTSANY